VPHHTDVNPTDDQLLAYFRGDLPPDQEEALDLALAKDAALADRARKIYALSRILAEWTPQAHGQAYRAVMRQQTLQIARQALRTAADRHRARLEDWIGWLNDIPEKSVHVALQELGTVTRWIVGQQAGAFAGALARGFEDELKVTAVREGDDLIVTVVGWTAHDKNPLLLLLPEGEAAEPRVSEARHSGAENEYRAIFEGVADQPLTLLVDSTL